MTTRHILTLRGADRASFLQGLITNDVTRATPDTLIYAALLTPQGKYLADFFVLAQPDALLLDVSADLAPGLATRLNMYRLRADVQIEDSPLKVSTGDKGLADPRHPALPRRLYGAQEDCPDPIATRVAHIIPQSGIELTPDSYILEAGFERLNGVDFKKGCYVGQEVTARMKHKTTLKKGLCRLRLTGSAPLGTTVMSSGKEAGTLYSQHGDAALAQMRFDRIAPDMQAGAARLDPEDA